MALATAESCIAAFWQGLRPDPLLTVSEWADQRRVLSPKASAEHGQWKTSRTPYLRRPMDDLSSTSRTREVTLVFGSQMGKSEALNNWKGYVMDIAPGPALFVQPTIDLAKRYSKMRIQPMIEATPTLREKVKESRSRDSGNTQLMKEFSGGLLILGGANAASGLASMPIRYLGGDEIDRWPMDVDEEGNPLEIVEARTRTFGARRKHAWTSTPGRAGTSAIWRKWEDSSQNHLKLPCPHCGHRQVLEWERMRWDEKDPGLPVKLLQPPVLICESCGEGISEDTKAWWYDPEVFDDDWWEPTFPERVQHQGYHCNALYAPLGWFSWEDAVLKHVKAEDNPALMQPFVNTVLALPYNNDGEAPDWEALYNRREVYEIGTVPDRVVFLTCGVDVQADRLELEVVGWGPGMESWSLDYQVLAGDTAQPAVWKELTTFVRSEFGRGDGQRLPIRMVAIDSGYRSQEVYRWVRTQPASRVIAIKGVESQTSVIGTPSRVEVLRNGKALRGGVKVWPVGTSTAKSELYGWLRRQPPEDPAEGLPHGWCHFPQYGQEWFQQLTAERLENTIDRRGYPKFEWVKTRPRNEALDCRCYARAAAALVGADRWSDERWAAEGSTVQEAPAAMAPKAEQSPREDDQPTRRRSSFWD
jgi:phage terminase large subunit GpA-like protein